MNLRRGALLAVVAAAMCVGLSVGLVASAGAEAPDFLLHMPAAETVSGDGAGELYFPGPVAGDSETGHVFIVEGGNNRISEYTAWGFFVKAWGWGVADGAPELQTCGPAEPQEVPDPALCQSGSGGDAPGQMRSPLGVAVDPAGDVYVQEWLNLRVQKFSPSGEFLLMFGGGVNQGPLHPGDVCTAAHVKEGDTCGKGTEGEGAAQLDPVGGDPIAYSPAEGGTILVGDKGGIQVFDLNGNYVKTIAFEGPLASFADESATYLDVDKDGNVYFALSPLSGISDIYKLSPTGEPLAPGKPDESSFDVAKPLGVAVDAQGNVYSAEFKKDVGRYVVGYETDGSPVAGMTAGDEFAKEDDLQALAINECAGSKGPNLYLARNGTGITPYSLVDAYGPGPIGCELPPVRPPEVLEQFASGVGREEATVKARINPLFWPDATYQVEYGTSPCSKGGCPLKAPLSPAALSDKSINAALSTAGVVLEGLEPQATYHYRFVAQSSGGGPVFGIDPDGRKGPVQASEGEGLEATFRTFRSASKQQLACANDTARIGPATQLPDCRAYEMVSPLDKGGGGVAQWEARNGIRPGDFETHQSALSGDRFTYTSFLAFGEAESAPFASQHLAEREAGSWRSLPISAPRSELPVSAIDTFDDEFQGFTEDLCRAWLRPYSVAPLAPGAIEEHPNLYRRENCLEPPTYEAITERPPLNLSPSQYLDLRTKGFSRDGSHVLFATAARLEGTGAPQVQAGGKLLYEHTGGELRFVCLLPSGKPSTEPCSAGTLVDAGADLSSLHNAVSDDGSRIFWTAYSVATGDERKPGRIFVRIDGEETRAISSTESADPAFFWTASGDGFKAIFSFVSGVRKGELYEFDVEAKKAQLIAKGVEGPMGASEDASRVYFASSEDLDAGGPAMVGEHNLYLYEADPSGGPGEITFIMRLGAKDVSQVAIVNGIATRPVDFMPGKRAARVSPDGLHAAFMSTASPTPTGYDNRDVATGDPVAEVYLYDAAEERLRCISCNPSGARPTSQVFFPVVIRAAALLQGWEQRHHAPRVLSDDGKRVFFESFEALVPRDTNGTWDVYQWEEAGKGTCTPDSETFSEDSGGCVDLISSGTSPAKSTFLDADPSGDNVFFSTQSSLVGADYGLNDVYLARVGGGFPEPVVRAPCAGEACQSPPPPPSDVTPATRTAAGPGNVRKRCPKGKRRVKRAGKVRCVKRKKAKAKKAKAGKNRRAGR